MTRFVLLTILILAACNGREAPSASRHKTPAAGPAATGGDAALAAQSQRGQTLMADYGCGVCHVIPGVAGANGGLGPTLAGVASRPTISEGAVQNTPANLAQYIQNPPSLNPDATMPALGFSDEEASAMAAYLLRNAR